MKKVDCIHRLLELTNCLEDIIDFMKEEKLITDVELADLKLSQNKARFLFDLFEKAKAEEKLQLLSYDWIYLPIERIKIRLLTNRTNKEYTYHW